MKSVRQTIRRFFHGPTAVRGNVAVEFALAAPIFLILVIGLTDFGRLFWVKNTLQFAVDETARYAMVNPGIAPALLVAHANSRVSGIIGGATFTATATSSGGIDYRTITGQYLFTYYTPIIPMGTLTLQASSTTPINTP